MLRYYPNINGNRFFEAEAGGEIDKKENDDTKLASSELTLKSEIDFAGLVKAQIEYTRKKAETGTAGGDWSNLAGGNSSLIIGRNGCNAVSAVPNSAQKRITGGRLNGMTDINPMWRIRELTELFGPCGIGWKYKIVREWLETASTGEVGAFVDIELQYRITPDADWSEPIPGTGGSKFVAAEKGNNLRASDECYKMALTDAISVACKALGFGITVLEEMPEEAKANETV